VAAEFSPPRIVKGYLQSVQTLFPPPAILRTRISTVKRLLIFLFVLAAIPSVASAKKFESQKNGQEVIAHTSRAPVAVHKVFPPYGLHRHVYAGKVQQ
jgi:hypothetical protein